MGMSVTFPGTSNNYIFTENIDAANLVGDIDLRFVAAAADWSAVGWQAIMDARSGAAGFAVWLERGLAAGNAKLFTFNGDGLTSRSGVSDQFAAADAEQKIGRATFDVSTGGWAWYVDGSAEGTATVATGAGVPLAGSLYLANDGGNGNRYTGDISTAEVWDGIGGTLVAKFNAANIPGGSGTVTAGTTWVDVTGRTWEVTGSDLTLTKDPDPIEMHGDALWGWVQTYDDRWDGTNTELVGALNQINGTIDKGYAEARGTYLDVPPAG